MEPNIHSVPALAGSDPALPVGPYCLVLRQRIELWTTGYKSVVLPLELTEHVSNPTSLRHSPCWGLRWATKGCLTKVANLVKRLIFQVPVHPWSNDREDLEPQLGFEPSLQRSKRRVPSMGWGMSYLSVIAPVVAKRSKAVTIPTAARMPP